MLKLIFIFSLFISTAGFAQQKLDKLTVEKIMRDPDWIGTSPSAPFWSDDGSKLYFLWNPEKSKTDSLYYITVNNKTPVKASAAEKQKLPVANAISWNHERTAYVYAKDGDIYYSRISPQKNRRVTYTIDIESSPQFSFNDERIVYSRSQNLYSWDVETGETIQLTNIRPGDTARRPAIHSQEQWLLREQLEVMEVLRERKAKKDEGEAYNRSSRPKGLRTIFTGTKTLQGLAISPDARFISYRLFKADSNKNTIVPFFVTESGFTRDSITRTKVGQAPGLTELFIYDRTADSIFVFKPDILPGIKDLPEYLKEYPKQLQEAKKKNADRTVTYGALLWSPQGSHALLDVRAHDNKDRWLVSFSSATGKFKVLDRQHDDAWIGGPGISAPQTGWIDENTIWFHSEATGYSHLYSLNVTSTEKKALTAGKFEVHRTKLSNDKKYFYITTNEVHPGEQHFYKMPVTGGFREQLTKITGADSVSISPDEKHLAILHSSSNQPWELFLQENKAGAKPEQITFKAQTDEFKTYPWRDPELVTYTASDGTTVYARLYKPANPHPAKPAILFVHGAGYLQNVHKWWSSYFREYMFNNMLADNGYYVLDIDYRGSAGYGRNWRTGIYRYMGGKDLSDHVDGVKWLIKNHGVDPKRIGVYGGSYGGFIALMGLFTEPDVFAAGAALRPVTDWANYNHGYTSNILNEPFTDSIAYHRSSPINFAEGLKGDLIMLHGMVDVNVHFQDAVKLSQRLIELGKDNWELAVYPMEDHGFIEPSSWTDEYKRIFKLFERVLKK